MFHEVPVKEGLAILRSGVTDNRCSCLGKAAVVLLLLSIISNVSYASAVVSNVLTTKQKTWLKQHTVIRVGVDPDYAPYSFKNKDGHYQGVVPDYLALFERHLGVRFEIVPNLSWPQIIESAKSHSLDIVATAVQTPERDTFLGFTHIYIPTPLVIMTQDGNTAIKKPSDLNGKKVALVKDYSSSQRVINEHPAIIPFSVQTPLQGLSAVASGAADAYVGVIGVNTYLMSKYGIANLKVAAGYEMTMNGQRLGIRKDWPELVSILNKTLDAIPEYESLAIMSKWIPLRALNESSSEEPYQLALTEQEQSWLAQHREIRLAVDPDFAPVEFIDEQGVFSGIAAEYVKLLNKRLGIHMKVVPGLTWSEAISRAKQQKVDVFSAITPSEDRSHFLNFTEPYFKYPVVIFTREEHPFITGLESLLNHKVAVVKDYVTQELVASHYPDVNLIPVPSIKDGLDAVSTGKVDAFVGFTVTASYNIRKYNYTNLKIAAPTEFQTPGLTFGVRKDWPLLTEILNKALNTVSPQTQLSISKKWIEIEVAQFPRYWIWVSATAAGLLLLFVVISSFLRHQVSKRTYELSQKNVELSNEVSERKRVESALIESEQRLSQFFHATFEMVFFHENGIILDVNPAAKQMTGYDSSELIGKNFMEFVQEGSRQTVINNMVAGIDGPYEINIRTKKGAVMPIEIHARNFDVRGITARVVSLRDITERKKHEMELQKAHDELEIKVEERTSELVTANEKLKELDRLKSMFIASVSHELRTPLNSIIGFSSMMMRQSFGTLNAKYKDYSSRINKSGQHLLALITDIIDLSKIESGRIDVESSKFLLEDLLDQAVNEVKNQAAGKNLSVNVETPKNISLYTDRRRLLQCLLNFLSNAVKYTETGGINILVVDDSNDVQLMVIDTGIGIGSDDRPKIFQAFERIDSHLRIKAGGTGLGLYLTQRIAEDLLKGRVGFKSELGIGSTFWIKFPKTLLTQKVTDKATV